MAMGFQLNSSVESEEDIVELYEGAACGSWAHRLASTMEYRPRQFEYHPTIRGRMVIGTLDGEIIVTDVGRDVAISVLDDCPSAISGDAILALCWLKTRPTMFAAGSSSGKVNLCTIREDGIPDMVSTYPQHGKTASVHLNCTDEYLITSGYSDNANLIDVGTGQLVRKFSEIHHGHINISRFSNLNPNVFATCSFDRTAKMWDIRDRRCLHSPIYECHSDSGHVMLCFSADDVFLLTSAVDNEVIQYLAVDGQKHLKLNIPTTEKCDNFTRAYYTADSQHILSGSSDQPEIRVHSAQTGDLVSCIEMYPGRQQNSIFIQSIRGDPHCCSQLSVLVNYKEPCHPLEIVHVDLSKHDESIIDKEPLVVRTDLGGLDTQDCLATAAIPLSGSEEEESKGIFDIHSLPSRQLALDLWCEGSIPFVDCVVICEGGAELKAHLALLSVRSPVLLRNCNFHEHCYETNPKQCQLPVLQVRELDHPFCDGSRLPPSHIHHHSSRCSQNSANKTGTGGLVQVFPPESAHSTVTRIVLRYLYTDELHEESVKRVARNIEIGKEFGYLLRLSPEDANRMQLIMVYERIHLASSVLLLSRLASLVEVKLRDIVDVASVIRLAVFSSRVGSSQLLSYCVSFISIHLEVILQLHANESLPSG